MNLLFAVGTFCSVATLMGCASSRQPVVASTSGPTLEQAAAETVEEMSAAMAETPETISPDAADLARLMAEMIRRSDANSGSMQPVSETLPAVAR